MSATDPAPDQQGTLTPFEELLAASAPDDAAAEDRVAAALLEELLGIPGRVDDDGGFAPLTLADDRGRSLGFAFTHQTRLEEFVAATDLETRDLVVREATGRTLFTQLVQADLPLVLNPHAGHSREFVVAEMSDRLAGRRPSEDDPARDDIEIQVDAPTEVPDGLVARLTDHLRGLGPVGTPGGVESATLAWVRYPDGLQGFVVGIRTALPPDRVTAGIDAAIGHLEGRFVDIVLARPGEGLLTDAQPAFLTAG